MWNFKIWLVLEQNRAVAIRLMLLGCCFFPTEFGGLPFQTLILIIGKRITVKMKVIWKRDFLLWRWQSELSGRGQPSIGMGLSHSSEERDCTHMWHPPSCGWLRKVLKSTEEKNALLPIEQSLISSQESQRDWHYVYYKSLCIGL